MDFYDLIIIRNLNNKYLSIELLEKYLKCSSSSLIWKHLTFLLRNQIHSNSNQKQLKLYHFMILKLRNWPKGARMPAGRCHGHPCGPRGAESYRRSEFTATCLGARGRAAARESETLY